MIYVLGLGPVWRSTPSRAWSVALRSRGSTALRAMFCCDVVNRGVRCGMATCSSARSTAAWSRSTRRAASSLGRSTRSSTTSRTRITGAPRVVKDKVLIGNGGADFGVRGYVTAYDSETGKRALALLHRPAIRPRPPENRGARRAPRRPGPATWWKIGGGGTVWDEMAYDPELDLLYIGTGNGGPWNRGCAARRRRQSVSRVIVALEPDTGRMSGTTRPSRATGTTPRRSTMILAELDIGGRARKVLMQAPKNGFFYVLDRANRRIARRGQIRRRRIGRAASTWQPGARC